MTSLYVKRGNHDLLGTMYKKLAQKGISTIYNLLKAIECYSFTGRHSYTVANLTQELATEYAVNDMYEETIEKLNQLISMDLMKYRRKNFMFKIALCLLCNND